MDVEIGKFAYRILCKDGSVIENPRIDGLEVEFRGRFGGLIEIEDGSIFKNSKISLGSGAVVTIKKTNLKGIKNTRVDTSCACKFKKLFIDEGCSIEGARFALVDDENLSITVGKDCMLGSNILLRPADGHTVFDVATGAVLNRSMPIVIGDHVWVGTGVTLLKGANVANNVVIGSNSLLSKRYDEEYVALAGTPARVVKRGINWSRSRIPEYERTAHRNEQKHDIPGGSK